MSAAKEKLDSHFDTYRKLSPYDDYMRHYTFETFKPFIEPNKMAILELGCSDGQMTEKISELALSLDVVDGSQKFIEQTKQKNLKNTRFFVSLFEEFNADKKYDVVFATYIITHIPDLTVFFDNVKKWLKPGGLLFVAVPNSNALSRQLALKMDLLQDLYNLSENDLNHGHCRCYDNYTLQRDIEQNGFNVTASGGIILKPLADFQMDKLINEGILKKEQMNALYKLGKEYPHLSAAIYSISKNN